MRKTVLVTGIGGNVGQGIIRNIRNSGYRVKIVGTNTEAVSAGNHLCDAVYKVSFSNSSKYIPEIVRICKKEKVDLIIPATDYESYYLPLAKDKLPLIASSDAEVTQTFLNKYKTWQEFKKRKIPFAETTLPSKYRGQFKNIVVKPIEGRGSRDIHVNPPKPKEFSDDFIIQRLYKGTEITTAFYVTKQGEVLGQMTFERTLEHGTTILCEVTFDYEKLLTPLIAKIVKNFKIRGSCNIQSIVVNKNTVVPFELNCRISGTNSIRSQFGFADVKYTLEEYLFNKRPKKPIIKKGAAVRILMDIIYPGIGLNKIKNKSTKHYMF